MHESPHSSRLSANRGGEIRTRDLLNPIQARYRAAPRPDVHIWPEKTGFPSRDNNRPNLGSYSFGASNRLVRT